jgi:hypothetical protein
MSEAPSQSSPWSDLDIVDDTLREEGRLWKEGLMGSRVDVGEVVFLVAGVAIAGGTLSVGEAIGWR